MSFWKDNHGDPKVGRIIFVILFGLVAAFVGLNLLFGSWYTVETGQQAIVLRFGAMDHTSTEGFHLKLPFVDEVRYVETRIVKHTTKTQAASKDLQVVHSEVALNYALNPSEVGTIYTKLGLEWEKRVIDPQMAETFKAVTARYTAEELVTKRETVREAIEADLIGKLTPYGIGVKALAITNFDFSSEFNAAIEAKQTAEQNALKAQRDLDRIKVEAEQKIASARAEAESLRIQKEQVTDAVLQLRAIEKWDGVLPQVTGSSIPFIQATVKDKR